MENRHAEIINKLRKSKSFDVLEGPEIAYFCIFVLLQRNRTKQKKNEMEDMIDDVAKELLQLEIESGEVDEKLPDDRNILDELDRFRVKREYPLAQPLLQALTSVELVIDLEVAVIVNTSDEDFIVSDHPVVHDNPRFKKQTDRFLVGLQNRGLQIFVPLSHDVQMLLYDPAAYFVEYSDTSKRRVITSSKEVVTALNDLQMINALENIFYREVNQKEKFISAQERLSRHINFENMVFKRTGPDEHGFDTENEILESGYRCQDYSPSLPFVTQRYDVSFAIQRQPEVAEEHREYLEELLEEARSESEESE